MEIPPGRAPFTEDEDYTPLRMPKSAATTPTHSYGYSNIVGGVGVGGGSVLVGAAPGGASFSGGAYSSPPMDGGYGRTSKLSALAKEFVPRFGGGGGVSSNSNLQDRLEQPLRHQQQQQQQYNHQTYQHYQMHQHQQSRQQQQQQQQQRYANGYQQNNQQQQQPQQQQQQHLNQQQPQQPIYSKQMASLSGSVQERLKIGGSANSSGAAGGSSVGGGGGINKNTSNNFYPQQHGRHNKHYHNNSHHNNHQNNHHQRYQHPHASNSHHNKGAGGSAAGGGGGAAEVEKIALDYLQTVIQCLNQNPGQFDTVATRFLTIFDGMENNQYVLANAMEDIFNESIQNPNFRYMGAKLYNLLHMLNLKKDSLFHTLLKCKLDFHQEEVVQYMQTNQQQKVRETALFLAELYMQLRGDDSRIHLIAENIVYSLKQLLSKESTDNLRCICLTLKLAGYDLTADCAEDMPDIIAQLESINSQNPGKYPLAANVISLQKNNWGRKISSSNSLSDVDVMNTPEPLRTSDEPIFYGPDGRELTAEEADFLSGGAAGVTGGSTDDDDDGGDLDIDLDPEMDEETEKAYKEFCKLNAT